MVKLMLLMGLVLAGCLAKQDKNAPPYYEVNKDNNYPDRAQRCNSLGYSWRDNKCVDAMGRTLESICKSFTKGNGQWNNELLSCNIDHQSYYLVSGDKDSCADNGWVWNKDPVQCLVKLGQGNVP